MNENIVDKKPEGILHHLQKQVGLKKQTKPYHIFFDPSNPILLTLEEVIYIGGNQCGEWGLWQAWLYCMGDTVKVFN